MANSNIAGYDITKDPFAPNLLHDTPTPEGEADLSASASVDDTTGTPSVTVTKTKTAPSTYNFDFAFTGLKGEQGETGATGPQGPQGPKGDDGEAQFPSMTVSATVDSATGSPAVTVTKTGTDAAPNVTFAFTGLKGETGATGPQGERGLQGETGAQGPQGIQGIQGETGPAGSDGVTPVISADGTVDSNTGTPSVEVTKTGTDAAPVFHFEFHNVKGDQGIPGTGADGVGITSIDFTSTDAQGNNVYTITLSNGQTYTFTANRGPAGETGAIGPQGPQGEQGIQGIQGIQGETGPAGATGATGATGNGIASIVFKETDASGNNVYTITMTDSSTYDITCPIGPTGSQGAAGTTPSITATATVDATSGTPAVTVTKTGTDAAPTYTFNFTGLKGDGGIPTGGTTNQVLAKHSNNDGDLYWRTVPNPSNPYFNKGLIFGANSEYPKSAPVYYHSITIPANSSTSSGKTLVQLCSDVLYGAPPLYILLGYYETTGTMYASDYDYPIGIVVRKTGSASSPRYTPYLLLEHPNRGTVAVTVTVYWAELSTMNMPNIAVEKT